jgi:hypothetical protein
MLFRLSTISELLLNFLYALAMSQASFATEPQDKVFALLNLSFNGDRYIPIPDYSQSIQDLCLDIPIAAVKATRSLDLLILFASQEDPPWPSWQLRWVSLSDAGGNVLRKMDYALRRITWRKDLDFQACNEFSGWHFSKA